MPNESCVSAHYSIAEKMLRASGCRHLRLSCLLFCLLPWALFPASAVASYPNIRFTAENIEHDSFRAENIRGELDPEGRFRLDAGQVSVPGVLEDTAGISVQGVIDEASFQQGRVAFRSRIQSGVFKAVFEFVRQEGALSAALNVSQQDLLAFSGLAGLPPQMSWLTRGILDAGVVYRQDSGGLAELVLQLEVAGLGFDSPDGRFAGEALALEATVAASPETWNAPVITGSITAGELLLDDFYRDFSGGKLDFAFRPQWDQSRLELGSIALTDNGAFNVEGRAELSFGGKENVWTAEISRLELNFPGAYERYMEPAATSWTLDGLGLTGRVSWSGQWAGGKFRSGDLRISDLSIVDILRHRFAFTGLDAHLRPGDHGFDSKLSWRGLLLGRINLGAGKVNLDSEPGKLAILSPLSLDVLGGRVNLRELAVLLPGAAADEDIEPDIHVKADIENVDMQQLTAALDWPSFSGKLSGEIPGVSIDDGVLDLEGRIRVNVFDGVIFMEDVRVERPFGVLPSLAANIEADNLDLEQLTGTFSFGRISGRIGGYVHNLRMLDWKPVAFDAWMGTPASQKGSNDISRRAVNHLTTLGGGRATTALTSPVMRLFNNFSYKRLGLGCRMQNNVCEIRGVSEDDVSVLIMEGAGVPKITIRAFNRRVDWPQLLGQLVAASEGEGVRVGD